MQRLEVSGAVRPIYGSLGVKRLRNFENIPIIQNKRRSSITPKDSQHRDTFNIIINWNVD